MEKPTPSTNVSTTTITAEDSIPDSVIPNTKAPDAAIKTQKQTEFRQDFARLLNTDVQPDKVHEISSKFVLFSFN